MAKTESKCRSRSVEENLRIWEEMKKVGWPLCFLGQKEDLRRCL